MDNNIRYRQRNNRGRVVYVKLDEDYEGFFKFVFNDQKPPKVVEVYQKKETGEEFIGAHPENKGNGVIGPGARAWLFGEEITKEEYYGAYKE